MSNNTNTTAGGQPDLWLYQSSSGKISHYAFDVVLWAGAALCIIICTLRFITRVMCFKKMFLEDYLMIIALGVLFSIAGILQHFLPDVYHIIAVQNHAELPGLDFPDRLVSTMRTTGIALVLCTVGVWLVKLNFLIFFHRLGHQIRLYFIFWWIALFLVISCGAVIMGIITYDCLFSNFEHLILVCSAPSSINYLYTVYRVSIAMDVLSDVIIWRSGINRTQKLLLTGIFLLVAFNLVITIIRGSIFGGVYDNKLENEQGQVLDLAWMLFWYYVEFIVCIVVACAISFRSLWAGKKYMAKDQRAMRQIPEQEAVDRQMRHQKRVPWPKLDRSVLDTLRSWEGTAVGQDDNSFVELQLASSHTETQTFDQGKSIASTNDTTYATSTDGFNYDTSIAQSLPAYK